MAFAIQIFRILNIPDLPRIVMFYGWWSAELLTVSWRQKGGEMLL
jgi:hypothetical protein